jgi:hypothetical protein
MQRHHQPRGDARSAMTGMIGAPQSRFERPPVDTQSKTDKWMVQVNQLLQIDLEQLPLWVLRLAAWTHRFPQFSSYFRPHQGKFNADETDFLQLLCLFLLFFRNDYL